MRYGRKRALDRGQPRHRFGLGMLLALCALLFVPLEAPAAAVTCTVPAERPSVLQAIADPTCTVIVLAAQTFAESITIARDLTLQGSTTATSTLRGTVTVEGSSTDALIADLRIDTSAPPLTGCDSLSVLDDAQLVVESVDVRSSATGDCLGDDEIFSDGFESGDTSAWSVTVSAGSSAPVR